MRCKSGGVLRPGRGREGEVFRDDGGRGVVHDGGADGLLQLLHDVSPSPPHTTPHTPQTHTHTVAGSPATVAAIVLPANRARGACRRSQGRGRVRTATRASIGRLASSVAARPPTRTSTGPSPGRRTSQVGYRHCLSRLCFHACLSSLKAAPFLAVPAANASVNPSFHNWTMVYL